MSDRLGVLAYYFYYKFRPPFTSRRQLERWQEGKLKRHLKYVSRRSPIYKGKGNLEAFPVIHKAFMMEHFNHINTVGIDRDEAMEFAIRAERDRDFTPKLKGITVGLSSGTSGRRGIFLVSDEEKAKWAGYILARFLPGSIREAHSIAFFMRADSNLYESVGSRKIRFHFFDIYLDMKEHIERLIQVQPRILAGQPSLLLMIAEEVKAGNIMIRPEVVISFAEVLEEADERRLKKAFGLSVIHQVYQCTEGCLASTCPMGTLHLNEDIVHIEREYLDDRRFVPVVTDLERKAQPVIRYRLNDILVERKEPCGCRSPFLALEKIEGREDDIFSFENRDGKEVLVFPDFIRRCMLMADGEERDGRQETWRKRDTTHEEENKSGNLGEGKTRQREAASDKEGQAGENPVTGDYRIVQESDGTITVYADLTEEEQRRFTAELKLLAGDRQFLMPKLNFKEYQWERGRKMKRIERKY